MDAAGLHETIVTSMSAVAPELPLSPELVLVSTPEEARLARRLLPDPEPAALPTAAAPRARPFPVGAVLFSAFCLANCVVPFAATVATG
jgi:hypothetical protein